MAPCFMFALILQEITNAHTITIKQQEMQFLCFYLIVFDIVSQIWNHAKIFHFILFRKVPMDEKTQNITRKITPISALVLKLFNNK